MDKILTKKDIAKHQQVSTKTVERWMKNKGLPFYKIGKDVRFKQSLYIEWCDETFKKGSN